MKKVLRVSLTTLGLALLLAQAAAALDRVYVRGKPPAEGTVTETHPEYVVLDKGGSSQKYPANDVVKVAYDEEPAELIKGRDGALAGQVESALKELQSIPANAVKRDEIRQELDFFKAYCQAKIALSSGGSLKQADEALFAFVRGNRGSFHTFEATELLGQLAVAQGDWENAAKRFAFLGKAPWPDYKLRATVFEARALTSQKDFPKAMEKYEAVIKTEDGSAEATRQKLMARVGKAICLAETGQPEQAIPMLEDIIKNQDSKDAALFARAYNALGRCHIKQKRSKEALLDYLHVDLLFFSDAEAHAEALFHLAKLWSDVNKADRAVAARTLLQQRYGGSVWTKQL